MRLAARTLLATAILVCGLAPGGTALAAHAAHAVPAAEAPLIAVVSADGEDAAAHPGRHRRREEAAPPDDFKAMMDRVFGPGRWRETSGYRTVAQENALRRAGAGTVPAGRLSRHSLGDPDAPGAYDAVVAGLTPAAAAAKLKRAGAPFARIAAEGAHGREGPHLHIELVSLVSRGASASSEN
jgi:hypothetical protein